MADDLRRGVDGEMVGADSLQNTSSTPWMGAFERVMGDQGESYQKTFRPRSRIVPRPSTSQLGDSASEVVPPSRSAAASPFKLSDADGVSARSRARSGSLGTASEQMTQSTRTSAAPRSLSTNPAKRKVNVASGPSLVAVEKAEDGLLVEDLYLNHAPGLHPLHIVNVSDGKRVLLRLGSDLDRGLAFLKRKRSGQDPKETIIYPTNTVKWAKGNGLHPSKLRDIRHLLANLESSDSLILEAGAQEDVFVSFRPGETESSRLQVPPRSPTPGGERQTGTIIDESFSSQNSSSSTLEVSLSPRSAPELSHAAPSSSDPSLHFKTMHASGFISLRASTLSTAEASVSEEGVNGAEPMISSSASNMSSSSSSRPPSFYSSNISSATSAPTTDVMSNRGDVQVIELAFDATYCRPQLAASKSLHRSRVQTSGLITLDFGDIFVGQSLEMEVYLHNQSQIDMFWQARLDDADNALHAPPLTLLDDEGAIVEAVTSADDHPFMPNLLLQGAIKRLKVAMNPAEPCRDYEQVVALTNMHNAGNTIRILVRANMLGKARDDALSILSGEEVDFGDCAGGHWTRQLLVLRNNCEQILDVHFNVEKGIEANFQLAELAHRNNEDQLVQQEAPMLYSLGPSSLAGTSESSESEKEQESSAASPSSPSSSSFLLASNPALTAQELARTPMANAQAGIPMEDPPFFALPGQDGGKKRSADEEGADEVDASSVASQAGSLPGSPTKRGPVQLSEGLILEPPSSSEPSQLSDKASSEEERENSHQSRPSSDALSSRPPSRGLLSQIRNEGESHGEGSGSVRSDVTAVSHDSRLGPFLAASSHGGSTNHSNRGGDRNSRLVRHGGAAALSGLRSVEQGHGNQLEELILRPGAEYRVIVSYRPPKGQADDDYTQGRLLEKTFRLLLDYARSKSSGVRSRGGRERKAVLCRIRTCTSFISVAPKMIDFGLANVGTKKSTSFSVTNHSELTARVDLRYVSKVLSMYRDEISIPPLQSLELRVDFFPRRVNEGYRKQVTVANLLNRANDEIFEVRSKNIDEQKVSFHSLFYRILTSTGSNYIDFGDVNINCTRLRTFSIENISKGKLTLELNAAQSEDLKLFVKASEPKEKVSAGVNRYAELEAADSSPVVLDNEAGRAKTGRGGRTTGVDLKERFLETIGQDSPASIRKENASWRIAQKDSHYRKGKGGQKRGEMGEKKEAAKKAPINLMSALKKGGKGRLTLKYGQTIAFKDNRLLSDFEFLDLASGPPVDGKRISAKSRKYHMLDLLETGKAQSAKGQRGGGEAKRRPSVGRLPSPLAREVVKKEGGKPAKAASTQSPALTGSKRKAEQTLHDAAEVSLLSLDQLLAAVELQSSSLSTFFLGNPLAEEQSVRTEINLQRELQTAISTGRLESIDMLTMEAGEDRQVIAVYSPNGSTRPHIQGNARKQDSRIFMRLVDFDTTGVDHLDEFEQMLRLENDELPVRELMVKSNICRSILELSQPHINFGQMNKGDVKTRKILIQNRSEWALRFCIRKSGNISSGDIKFKSSDRYGVVPGHGKREVEFVFCPTLTGAFQEKLIVENVADRDKDEIVFLKANVRKVSNFKVEPSVVDFDRGETLMVGAVSTGDQSIVVSNVSSKARTFVIGVDEEQLRFQTFKLDVLLNSSNDGSVKAVLSKAEEEEVEHISQKLKIANRKGQTDKIKKYQDRLSELGISSQKTSPVLNGDKGAVSSSKDDRGKGQAREERHEEGNAEGATTTAGEEESSKLKQVSSTVTLTLAASQSKKLTLRLRPLPTTSHDSPWQHDSGEFSINIRVHEVKNTDEVQTVEIRGRAQGFVREDEVQDLPREEGWITFSATSGQGS